MTPEHCQTGGLCKREQPAWINRPLEIKNPAKVFVSGRLRPGRGPLFMENKVIEKKVSDKEVRESERNQLVFLGRVLRFISDSLIR